MYIIDVSNIFHKNVIFAEENLRYYILFSFHFQIYVIICENNYTARM